MWEWPQPLKQSFHFATTLPCQNAGLPQWPAGRRLQVTGVPPRSSLSPQNKERQRAPEKGETESQEKERAERNSNRSGWHREVVAVMALCHMSNLSTGEGWGGERGNDPSSDCPDLHICSPSYSPETTALLEVPVARPKLRAHICC